VKLIPLQPTQSIKSNKQNSMHVEVHSDESFINLYNNDSNNNNSEFI